MQLQHLHSEHELQIEFQRHRFALEYELAEADAFLNLECDNESVRSLPIEPANSGLVADSHSISGHFSRGGPTDVLHSGLPVVGGGPGTVTHTNRRLTGTVGGSTAISRSGPTTVSHGGPTAVSHGGPTAVAHGGPTAVSNGGPTAVSHGGPTAVSHGGSTAVSHGGPTAVSHGGPTAVSNSGPTAVSHGGPTAVSHGGPTAVSHGGPIAVSQDGPTAVSHRGPTAVSHVGLATVSHGGPTAISHRRPAEGLYSRGPAALMYGGPMDVPPRGLATVSCNDHSTVVPHSHSSAPDCGGHSSQIHLNTGLWHNSARVGYDNESSGGQQCGPTFTQYPPMAQCGNFPDVKETSLKLQGPPCDPDRVRMRGPSEVPYQETVPPRPNYYGAQVADVDSHISDDRRYQAGNSFQGEADPNLEFQRFIAAQTAAYQQIASSVSESQNLPKPELLTFDGNPLDYWRFINNFDANMSLVSDVHARLKYLIQHCKGKAKEAIQDCVTLRPVDGYNEARQILHDIYGRPHVIARSYIDQLVRGSDIRPSDVQGLQKLGLLMQKSQRTLGQMGCVSDLDNSENLLKITRPLPNHIRAKWVERADSIIEAGYEPNFADLTRFVQERARVVNIVWKRFKSE